VIESPVCIHRSTFLDQSRLMTTLSARSRHHLQLELFPPDDRLFYQHGVDGGLQTQCDTLVQLLRRARDRAAGAAQRERGADDDGVADRTDDLARFVQARDLRGARKLEPDTFHRSLKSRRSSVLP